MEKLSANLYPMTQDYTNLMRAELYNSKSYNNAIE